MPTLIVLTGPTASGKTAAALQVAEHFHAPILNADSRQIYRDIPIGTAAPTAEEQARVPHYFVGTLALDDYYSAARYEAEVMELLPRLFAERDVVVMSGGSMMYIDAVCNGIDDIPTISEETRTMMRTRYEQEGLELLLAELRLADPEYYAQCDRRNYRRIIHALEVIYQSGKPFSSFRHGEVRERPFRIIKIGLQRPRPELFARINARVGQMMEQGWLDEVRRVMPYRHCNALNTVGYKELFQVLDGVWPLDFALARIAKNTRVYAKKQITWFAKDPAIHWLDAARPDAVIDFCKTQMDSE